jgi:hypothetical protein
MGDGQGVEQTIKKFAALCNAASSDTYVVFSVMMYCSLSRKLQSFPKTTFACLVRSLARAARFFGHSLVRLGSQIVSSGCAFACFASFASSLECVWLPMCDHVYR